MRPCRVDVDQRLSEEIRRWLTKYGKGYEEKR